MTWTILLFLLGITLLIYALNMMGFVSMAPSAMIGAKPANKSLSDQYYFKKGGVVFCPQGNFLTQGEQRIRAADPATFLVLAYHYAKDKGHCYFQNSVIAKADPNSFIALPGDELVGRNYIAGYHARDKQHAYYMNRIVANASTDSFKPLWGDYSRDANAIYFRGKRFIETSSVAEKLAGDQARDYLRLDHTLFYKDKSIDGANPEGFMLLGQGFAKDAQHVFYYDQQLEGVDAATFRRLGPHYSRDEQHVFFHDDETFKLLPNSDPGSFTLINQNFSKDSKQVYYHSRIVSDVTADGFDRREADKLENDDQLLLINDDEDHCTFARRDKMVAISSQYYIYNHAVYNGNTRVRDAEVDGFAVFEESGMYAKDKNYIFYRAYTIKGADRETFSVINSAFAKDKNHVYFHEKRLLNIKPDTFEYREGMYGESVDEETARLFVVEPEV